MSIESIKAISNLSEKEIAIFNKIPEDEQDNVLDNIDTFKQVILRQEEFLISLGYEEPELTEAVARSVIQSYEVAR